MPYWTVKTIVLVVFVAYAMMAMSLRGSVQDVYPVFSWMLFSFIPNPNQDYAMEILEAGSMRYDPPLKFSQSKGLFEKIQHSPTEYAPRVDRLGQALARNDVEEAARVREELEVIFGNEAFRYQIFMIYADPVEYWKTGSYRVIRMLGEFSSSESS